MNNMMHHKQEKLQEFIDAATSGDNSHLITIPAGILPSDVLMSRYVCTPCIPSIDTHLCTVYTCFIPLHAQYKYSTVCSLHANMLDAAACAAARVCSACCSRLLM
jgi:hypothetical protein